jgi:hypothetical protein
MQKPIIGLNAQELANAYVAASVAVTKALETVKQCRPSRRDYEGDAEYCKADAEHWNRLHKLRDIDYDLSDLAAHCAPRPVTTGAEVFDLMANLNAARLAEIHKQPEPDTFSHTDGLRPA